MKQQVNPLVAIGITVVVVIIAGVFLWRGTGTGSGIAPTSENRGMPPDVAAEMNRRMGGMQGAGDAPKIPGGGTPVNTATASAGSGAGYLAPPTGR